MIKGKLIDDCYEYRILSMNIEVNQKLGMNNIPVCVPDHIKYHLEVESDRHPHFLYCIAQTVRRDLIQLKFESARLGEKGRVFNLYDCIVPKFEEEFNHTNGEPLKMKLTLVAGMSYLNGEFMERLEWCRFNRDLIDKDPMMFTQERAREALGEDITTSSAPQEEQLLVKTLEGPFTEDGRKALELIMGNTYIYKVTEYNTGEGDKLNSTNWSAELNNSGKLNQLDKSNAFIDKGTICYKYTPEKAENITIYAWCNEATKDVSVDVPVVCFPFCVDRYKVPGLNPSGTNIAEDLTYGIGVATKTSDNVYSEEIVKQYKDEYIKNGFNIEKHAAFANIENLKENPFDKSFNYSTPSEGSDHFANVQRDIDAQNNANMMKMADEFDKANYPKAIYSKERIYNARAWLIENWVYEASGKDVKDYHEGNLMFWDTSDENIFKAFEDWATLCYSYGEMQGNIKRMIAKFKRNEGGIFEDPVLTNDIANHKATLEYCSNLEDFIAEKIKTSKGKLTDIIENGIDKNYDERGYRGKTTAKGTKFAKPTFGSLLDTVKGETIALNDIWATEVYISGIKFDKDNYKVKYEVTLWDHFGLDITDIEDIPNTVPLAKEAFAAWFALQHLRGYKPFITKMTFSKEFIGNINEGKTERYNKRETLKAKQARERINNLPEFKSL